MHTRLRGFGRLTRPGGAATGRLLGFTLSVSLLAVASLCVIPALIAAGGDRAWGAIALGQTVGGVAAVVVYFGWGHSGPTVIARSDAASRLQRYRESVVARLLLLGPALAAAVVFTLIVTPSHPLLAALGCSGAATVGLTSDWYYVGTRRPYAYLVTETLPRVAGTFAAVIALTAGADPALGLVFMIAGPLAAFATSSWWILRTADRVPAAARRPVRVVLAEQRHGVASSIGTALYSALPLVLVSIAAPGIQPVYALVDKLQRQISVGVAPFVSMVQGYVPQVDAADNARRARRAIFATLACCVVLAAVTFALAPWLVLWLGVDEVQPPMLALGLMAVFVSINLWESVLARAVLASLGLLRVVAWGTLLSALVGFPLIVWGAMAAGVTGALGGLVVGLGVRALAEAIVALRHTSPSLYR